VARGASSLLIRGRLQRVEGVVNIVAEHIRPLATPAAASTATFVRNFR
jgi:error-prone DNA polymerase